jgi:indole-3-glycerol phosphate synthase
MNSILETIAAKTRLRVAQAKESITIEQLRSACEHTPPLPPPKNSTRTGERVIEQMQHGVGPIKATVTTKSEGPPLFEQALTAPGLSFICEVKKASPSKGVIADDFPYLHIARAYESAGAAAISVLTEPDYFLGDPRYLREIAAEVKIPVLRKDFVVDDYQLYEAKIWGAQAVLLICALLDTDTLARSIKTAADLGLASLVEIHDEAEAEQALAAGARIIGINNRDLNTFNVDLGVTARLKKLLPAGVITVTESGIKSPDDIRALKDSGIDAVLIGESLMRAPDKRGFLAELKAAYHHEN